MKSDIQNLPLAVVEWGGIKRDCTYLWLYRMVPLGHIRSSRFGTVMSCRTPFFSVRKNRSGTQISDTWKSICKLREKVWNFIAKFLLSLSKYLLVFLKFLEQRSFFLCHRAQRFRWLSGNFNSFVMTYFFNWPGKISRYPPPHHTCQKPVSKTLVHLSLLISKMVFLLIRSCFSFNAVFPYFCILEMEAVLVGRGGLDLAGFRNEPIGGSRFTRTNTTKQKRDLPNFELSPQNEAVVIEIWFWRIWINCNFDLNLFRQSISHLYFK